MCWRTFGSGGLFALQLLPLCPAKLVFHQPVLILENDLHGPDGTGAMSQFYALTDTDLFGQADEVGRIGPGGSAAPNPMPMYFSSDGGQSWAHAGDATAPTVAGTYEPIPGSREGTLRNFGALPYEYPPTAPPWQEFSSANTTTFSVGRSGALEWSTATHITATFTGFPAGVKPCRNPHLEPNGWRLQGTAHVVTPDGAIVQTVIACVGGSHHGSVPGTENATSILAFRST